MRQSPRDEVFRGDRRTPPVTREIVQLTRTGTRWEVTPDFASLLDDVLRAPGVAVKASAAKLVERREVSGRVFYVKIYRHDAFALRPFKFFFKQSPARREWDLAACVEQRGIPVVRHVALGERRSARGLLESILITEAFDGVPLNEAVHLGGIEIIHFVERLAMAGLRHTDLHPANLLFNQASGEIRLVDLDGMELA